MVRKKGVGTKVILISSDFKNHNFFPNKKKKLIFFVLFEKTKYMIGSKLGIKCAKRRSKQIHNSLRPFIIKVF